MSEDAQDETGGLPGTLEVALPDHWVGRQDLTVRAVVIQSGSHAAIRDVMWLGLRELRERRAKLMAIHDAFERRRLLNSRSKPRPLSDLDVVALYDAPEGEPPLGVLDGVQLTVGEVWAVVCRLDAEIAAATVAFNEFCR